MYRTTNGFDSLSLADFVQLINKISSRMTGNDNFTDLQPDVILFNTDKENFLYLVNKAAGGDKAAVLERNAKRVLLIRDLRYMGNNVTAIAKGDLVILESSGFPISKGRQASPPLTTPAPPKIWLGVNKGQLVCKAQKQHSTDHVIFMISSDPDTVSSWTLEPCSEDTFAFPNLVSATKYYFKYSLLGVRNQRVMSEMTSYISQ